MRRTVPVVAVVAALAAVAAVPGCSEPAGGEPAALVISEVAAAGVPDDWIEIVNAGETPVELVDYVVVDSAGELDRARPLGDVVLGPGERHVQVISDASVGFRLAGDEAVWLYRASDGALVDGVDWRQGASPPGGSLARSGDRGAFVTVTTDSRGRANGVLP